MNSFMEGFEKRAQSFAEKAMGDAMKNIGKLDKAKASISAGLEKAKQHFTKNKDTYAIGGAIGAGAGGLGALSGHASHINKKMDYARRGKDYKPESVIDKNPKLTGAASLGIAPAISAFAHKRKLDMDNPKVRKVLNEHPFMANAGLDVR